MEDNAVDKVPLKLLDSWQKENEIPLDDYFRLKNINWNKLDYVKKLEIYGEYLANVKKEKEVNSLAARQYHARPEVIAYFKRNKLLHESGDYREQPQQGGECE